jgi:hypothetical protein
MKRREALWIAAVPVAVIGLLAIVTALSFVMKSPFRAVFRFMTAEDSLLEWPQFVCGFASSAIFGFLGIRFLRDRHRAIRLIYPTLALGALFVAGEEISWGQRLFGWSTPESLGAINHQDETNVHNIHSVQRAFTYMLLVGAMYCSAAPILVASTCGGRARPALSFLLVPPLSLIPAFLMPFGYRMFRLVVWPERDFMVVKFGEGPELCLYFGLLMFGLVNLRRLRVTERALVNAMEASASPDRRTHGSRMTEVTSSVSGKKTRASA